MRNRGIGIVDIIIFVGLLALIAWGLNYLITKDYVVVKTPTPAISNNNLRAVSTSTTQNTVSAQISTPTPVATSTPTKASEPTKTATTTPTTQTTSALTVTFTDKGFSPASLTIKKGQTVTFVNKSTDKMWVAANPFPSSADYPAFNEKSGVASGSSWSFTFDKTGVWFYHNHYHPAQGAKIVVNAK